MKPLLKLIRSIWLIALVVLPGFALAMSTPGMAALAIAYDAQTQPTIAYHVTSLSASGYDAAPALAANERENPCRGSGHACAKVAEFLAANTGVNANRLAGARAVDDFIAHAEANGMQVVGRETTFNTPFGARRMDVILQNPQTGLIGGVEVKSSLGAFKRFDAAARQQFSADRWINTFGATSVGEQSGITINNTIKIMWPAPPAP